MTSRGIACGLWCNEEPWGLFDAKFSVTHSRSRISSGQFATAFGVWQTFQLGQSFHFESEAANASFEVAFERAGTWNRHLKFSAYPFGTYGSLGTRVEKGPFWWRKSRRVIFTTPSGVEFDVTAFCEPGPGVKVCQFSAPPDWLPESLFNQMPALVRLIYGIQLVSPWDFFQSGTAKRLVDFEQLCSPAEPRQLAATVALLLIGRCFFDG